MNKYKKFICFIVIIETILVLICNGLYIYLNDSHIEKLYRVEANRVVKDIEEKIQTKNDMTSIDLSKYKTIVAVKEFKTHEVCNNDYVVEEIGNQLYRIEYSTMKSNDTFFIINGALLSMVIISLVVLFYVYKKVIKPFNAISHLSYELAKGNLSTPIKEEKSKLFGHFLWGMDMLREKLEENKKKELEFHKDRKTLILSLSHDIKTPLSSIELYSKALENHLYDSQEKKDEALKGIIRNVKEIKKYVDEITVVSREDFLNLEVINSEFYLSEIMKIIESYYKDKLSVIHTEFKIAEFSDCLIKGDKDRLIEVLQNIIENAIKYGDGKSIQIYFENEEDCQLIHIVNYGSYLKKEELPNVFDSFYRGSNSHGIKGNGLGLYICKNLMHKMDGEIFAQAIDKSFRVSVVIRKA